MLRVFIGLRQPDGFGFVGVLSVKQRSIHVPPSANQAAANYSSWNPRCSQLVEALGP